MDLDVSRAGVTSRVTSYAHAAELVAHTRVLEGIMRNSQHQYQKIMAAHIHPLGLQSQHGTRAAASEASEPLAAQQGPDAHAADAADDEIRGVAVCR